MKSTELNNYIEQLPEDRQEPFRKLFLTIQSNLPEGFEACQSASMLAFVVPHSIYPKGYHCNPEQPLPFIALASQKNFIAMYHMGLYGNPKLLSWFTEAYPKHVKSKLDMGKSCVRFKKMHEIPYELIAELSKKITVQDWIACCEQVLDR